MNNFDLIVKDIAIHYPHQVHIEMHKHQYWYMSAWLAGRNYHEDIEYEHYTYKKNNIAYIAMCFKDPGMATLFGLIYI